MEGVAAAWRRLKAERGAKEEVGEIRIHPNVRADFREMNFTSLQPGGIIYPNAPLRFVPATPHPWSAVDETNDIARTSKAAASPRNVELRS